MKQFSTLSLGRRRNAGLSSKSLIHWQSILLSLFFILISTASAYAHGVLVGYQVGSFPNGNNVRVWIEHWHSATSNVSSFPLEYRLIPNGVPGNQVTTYATGYVNNLDSVALQQQEGDIKFLAGACSSANSEGNWVYWDFNLTACGNDVVDFEIISGPASTTMEGCASLYPQTINGVNVPGINAPDAVVHTCPPYQSNYTIPASDLSAHFEISALCDPNPTISLGYGGQSWTVGTTPVPNWTFPRTGSSVSITATDNTTGKSANATLNLSFADAKPPQFVNFLTDTTIYGDANCQAVYNYSVPQGIDGCGGTPGVVQTAGSASGTTLGYGPHLYTFKVQDAEGNETSASFTVTVADSTFSVQDITTGTMLANQTMDVDRTGLNAYAGNSPYTFSFQDPLPADAEITNTEVIYTVSSNYHAHNRVQVAGSIIGDAFPNNTTGQFSVSKSGNLPNYSYGGSNEFKLYSWWNSVMVTEVKIRFTYAQNTGLCQKTVNVPLPQTNSNCGYMSVYNDRNYSNNASGNYPVGTTKVTWYVNDGYGNQSTYIQNITVTDDELPTIVTVADTLYLDNLGQATLGLNDVVTSYSDNCGVNNIFLSRSNFSCSDLGQQQIAVTATDIHGNQKIDSVMVMVVDTTRPTINFPVSDIYLDASGLAYLDSLIIVSGISDNCIDTAYADHYQFSCSDAGTATVTITALDQAGNTTVESFAVNVHDTISPTLLLKDITAYLDANGNANIDASLIDNGSSDGCGIDTLTLDKYSFSCADSAVTVKLTATDVNGNSVSASAEVIVLDTISPEPLGHDLDVYLDANGMAYVYPGEMTGTESYHPYISTYPHNGIAIFLPEFDADPALFDGSYFSIGSSGFHQCFVNYIDQYYAYFFVDTNGSGITPKTEDLFAGGGPITFYDSKLHDADNCGLRDVSLAKNNFSCSDVGSQSVTVTTYDKMGNSADTIVSVNVHDTIPPLAKVRNNTVFLDASGHFTITANYLDNGTSDACGIDTISLNKYHFSCADVGNNSVTLIATDVNGNSSSATSNLVVVDTIVPSLAVKNITVYLNASGQASIEASLVNDGTTDACGIDSLHLSQYDFDCNHLGVNTVSFTATDLNGNQATISTTVTVIDSVSPVLQTQNITRYLDEDGEVTVSAAEVDNASSDACGIDTLVLSTYNFSCTEAGVNTISLTATDLSGNSSSAMVTVTIVDTISPQVQVQDVSAYLGQNGLAGISASQVDNGSSDVCGIQQLSLSKSSFSCGELGTQLVTFTAEDLNGNTSSAPVTITVVDTITPLAKAQNLLVYLDNSGQATVTPTMADKGSSDNCDFKLSLSQSLFNCSDKGLNLETLTVTDSAGNSSSANLLIEVRDTLHPSLLTKTVTIQLGATGQASIAASQLDGGSYDNCSNQLFFTASKTSFDCSDLGANNVMVTVTDAEGNISSGSTMVLVEDNLKPVAQAQNLTVSVDASGSATITPAMINNGSSDNCSIDSMWVSQEQFNCTHLGSNSLQFTVIDNSGNSHSTNFVVTVEDNTAPVVHTRNVTVYLDSNGVAAVTAAAIDDNSTDNCSISALSLDQSSFSCADLGLNNVILTVNDAYGNSTSASAQVTVMDTISPLVNTSDITVSLDASGVATIAAADIDNGSSDPCGIQSMSLDHSSFGCADMGANTVVLTVTDNNGNTSSKSAVVTVVDNNKPLVLTQNRTIYLDASGNASVTASDIDNGSIDNCAIDSLGLDISNFDCADLGQNLVILTATDSSGNTASKSAFVTVLDTIDPSIDNLPATLTVYAPANQCAANVQWPAITGSDNCMVASVNTSKANGAIFPLGTTTVNVTVNDGSGNMTASSFDVVVVDTVSPVVSNVPANYTVIPNTNGCDAVVNWIEPVGFDNCGGISWTKSHLPGSVFTVGSTTVSYTATDADNNATTVSFVVTVSDQVDPVISGVPANITVAADAGACSAAVNFSAATVSDNCSGATLTASHNAGAIFPLGTTTVSYSALDAAGNTAAASFTVTVVDNEIPTVVSMPASDTVGYCGAAYTYSLPVATDNCGNVNVTQIAGLPSGSIFPAGVTVNAFKISDGNGNDTTVSVSLVVVPQGQPTLPSLVETCENEMAVDLSQGQNMSWSGNGIVNGSIFDPSLAGDGRHNLAYQYTDEMGCVATGTISVTVLPAPEVPVIVQIGSTTISTTKSYSTYQWYRNGVKIAGATSSSFTYGQSGNYQVMVGNSFGCELYGAGYVVGTAHGGIGLIEVELNQLAMYPNPSSGRLTIDLMAEGEHNMDIVVYSVEGKRVFEQHFRTGVQGKLQLDLGHLPDATYFMHITKDGDLAVSKLILY